jgi:hypothetical protein
MQRFHILRIYVVGAALLLALAILAVSSWRTGVAGDRVRGLNERAWPQARWLAFSAPKMPRP